MADIKKLQEALDKKAIDTSKLNRKQLGALDKAFKEGILKGYSSVSELQHEQGGAAESLATEKEKQLRKLSDPKVKLKNGGEVRRIARGCGKVMSNRRKKTKYS